MNLIYKTSIDCAHSIPDTQELITKKCATQHGHTYNFEIFVNLSELKKFAKVGFFDFALLKEIVESILSDYDHKDLSIFGINTVEQLCLMIKARMKQRLSWQDDKFITVRVFETAKYGVEC